MFKKILLIFLIILLVLATEAVIIGLPQSWLCQGRRAVNGFFSFNPLPDFGCVPASPILENSAWERVVVEIKNCQVTGALQTRRREVIVTLKDGRRLMAIEPDIDDVMDIIGSVHRQCGDFSVGSE